MQERSHAFAMKSQMWLLDPRPNISAIVEAVEAGFELSEASNTPVMLQLRLRSCHLHGGFTAKNNVRPPMTIKDAIENPKRDLSRIVLPPASFLHEQEKVNSRWPAAVEYITRRGLNEVFANDAADVGIIVQGGLYNTLNRALELLGCSDAYGNTKVPLYVMNVTYPVVDSEILDFCAGKRAVLMLEEGQPDYIEQSLNAILRRAGAQTALHGKDLLPVAGEYTTAAVTRGLAAFLERYLREAVDGSPSLLLPEDDPRSPFAQRVAAAAVHGRPPGLCTGCPERPIFSALKLAEREIGQEHHVSADIGCHLFSINEPFNIGATTMGYGLGSAGAAALNSADASRRTIAVMGDGGFWHNGLTSGVGNAVFNDNDQLLLVVDNAYSAATGGQDVLSSAADNPIRSTKHPIEKAVRGVGVKWAKTVTNTYKVGELRDLFVVALTSKERGPKVIVAQSECQLNRQRRVRPETSKAIKAGKRVVRQKFGVDADTCTGDHACIRISGCPSLTIKPNPDPMRTDPVATVLDSCVGCGVCGANAHAAALCPSFYRTDVVINETRRDRALAKVRSAWAHALSGPIERRAAKYEMA
jgi:indolepyruvate ferredoxin oxidoreductase alpha subunit